ncbi:MAG TPA: IS66 family transposase [Rectinema sp.]|nr:IS66 family transposase [Rectinema sp.]
MALEINTLPDDPALLKNELSEQLIRHHELEQEYQVLKEQHQILEEQYQTLEEQHQILEEQHQTLEEKHQTLVRKFFGKRSEKLTPEDELQGRLFNEAEDGLCIDEDKEKSVPMTEVKAHKRKKRGRKPIPDDLPREEVIHDIPEEEKLCRCCGGLRPVIGTEESEELDIVPAKITVLRHIKKKYGPCGCDGFLHSGKPEVITAKMPERMLPGSIASSGLLAYTVTSKFADALPFYRQSKIFERIGVDISRATLCNWAIGAYERMADFFSVFIDEMKKGPFMRMDETTVQVLHEEGRPAESKSYMWVAIGYPARGHPLVLYQYHPTRSQNIPCQFLEGFRGYLQTDGYPGYSLVGNREGVIHVGCFAHARRYFFDAAKLNRKDSRAHRGLGYIQKLYEIENRLRSENLDPDIFVKRRKKESEPVLDKFHDWLVQTKPQLVPSSRIRKAVDYTLKEWDRLIRYLEVEFLTPDNNEIERAIRPFVIGRKNWLFSNTPRGAHASAAMYSLVESAKANGIEPYHYLRFLFTRLPKISERDELKSLFPCFVNPEDILAV